MFPQTLSHWEPKKERYRVIAKVPRCPGKPAALVVPSLPPVGADADDLYHQKELACMRRAE